MITKQTQQKIDQAIKHIWLHEINEDYGNGRLLREASLQSSLYHHLRVHLDPLLNRNNLFIYPEFYIHSMKYRADLAIVEIDMKTPGELSKRVTDIASIIELKFDGGLSQGVEDAIKADLQKMKQYSKQFTNTPCQFYFGAIYETECTWLHWLDRRSTSHWANGCMTELNAGYLNGEMIFEVNSYNHMNTQTQSIKCELHC